MRIVVVLPEPLGPRKPSTSPGRTSKERSTTTSVSPKRFQTPRTSTAVSAARLSGAVAWIMACRLPQARVPSPGHAGSRRGHPARASSVTRTGPVDGEDNGTAMRIVSLLPSATEIVFALGLGDWLVGRSHRCDYPEEVVDVPVVTSAGGRHARGPSADGRDRALLTGGSTWTSSPSSSRSWCSPRPARVARRGTGRSRWAARPGPGGVGRRPRSALARGHLQQHLHRRAPSRRPRTRRSGLVELLRERLGALENHILERRLQGIASRRVVVLEWLEPPIGAGRWVPELVRRAGGWELLGREGEDPEETTWERLREVDPEVLVLALRGLRRCLPRSVAWQADDPAGLVRRPGGRARRRVLRGGRQRPPAAPGSARHRGHRRARRAPRPGGLRGAGPPAPGSAGCPLRASLR